MKLATVLILSLGTLAFAQQPPQPQPAQPPRVPGLRVPGGPMGRGLGPGPGGKWWDNPEMARRIGVTSDQKKKMDDAFLQNRMKLVDLHASLEKDELTLEGLMQGPQLDDAKILPVVDKIAQDRAELEKADARFLLAIRHILTPEQWTALNQMGGGPMIVAPPGPARPGMPGMPGRPGMPGMPGTPATPAVPAMPPQHPPGE
ncbi:MAG TPA: periplasmic heavy metal sensor [Bryobacteraceae bacterium]|nr:periplasmic heavy metal sensor [Bryobacteraceae bacterium]